MTRLPLANRIFVKLAALVFVAVFSVVPSHAQQDFEIMVFGSWQFVSSVDTTGNDRMFVIAPYDVTHIANFWSGTDASMNNWKESNGMPGGEAVINPNGDSSHPNVYCLDFLGGGKRDTGSTTHGKRELVYETTTHVLPSTVYKVLNQPSTTSRYAISLPPPDYVRTYAGTKLLPGTAEAEISNTVPDGSTAQRSTRFGLCSTTASKVLFHLA
jgi:hypothetical protein